MEFIIKANKNIALSQLKALYDDVGWYAYTKDMDLLQQACLLGLVRIVGDGLTIIYIQDILVLNAYQNKGIASKLMQHVLMKYKNVRQKVLLTEEAPDVRHFYEKQGFISCDEGSLVAFAKLN